MTNGQAGGNPNVAGRIRDLIVEPVAGLRIYAASGTGGVWFSADRGETWTPLDEFQESDRTDIGNLSAALACGAVHVKFGGMADGSQDVVWVGTGEPSLSEEALPGGHGGGPGGGLPGGKLAGVGFLHHDPSVGPGWALVLGETAGVNPDTLRGESFYRIAADPNDDTQLVAGTSKGLYVLPAGYLDEGRVLPDHLGPAPPGRGAHPAHRTRSGAHLGRCGQRRAGDRSADPDQPGHPGVGPRRARRPCVHAGRASPHPRRPGPGRRPAPGRHAGAVGHRRHDGVRPGPAHRSAGRQAHHTAGACLAVRHNGDNGGVVHADGDRAHRHTAGPVHVGRRPVQLRHVHRRASDDGRPHLRRRRCSRHLDRLERRDLSV